MGCKMKPKLVEHVCKFCGRDCYLNTVTKRLYDSDGVEHVKRCPLRAEHFHQQRLEQEEKKRRKRWEEYNRLGTETAEGERMTNGFSITGGEDDG